MSDEDKGAAPGAADQAAGSEEQGTSFWSGMAQFPDEYKEDAEIASFGGFGGMAKELKSRGEQLANLTKRPESPDGYDLSGPQLPEGVDADDAVTEKFRAAAHKYELSQEQARGIQDMYNELAVDDYNKSQEEKAAQQAERSNYAKATERELRQEYGPEYDEKTQLALRTLQGLLFGDEPYTKDDLLNNDFLQRIEEVSASGKAPISSSATFMKLFIRVGELNQEQGWLSSGGGGTLSEQAKLDKEYPSMKGMKESDI